MMNIEYHNPVLLHEAVDGLAIKPDGIYVDVTFGGGGHSSEILRRLGPNGKLYAFDQDEDALRNSINDSRFQFIPENFRFLKRYLKFYGITKVDGVLADLGVSSHQFDLAERGFSTRFEGSLDMRMCQSGSLNAHKVLHEYDETALRNIFLNYGEVKNAGAIAYTIVHERKTKSLESTTDLKEMLQKFLPAHKSNKILAQIYQAIRIEVNQELESLKALLEQSLEILNPGGRLCVISYHSLEDRLVKRFLKNGMFEGEPERDFFGRFSVPFKIVEKLIIPSDAEIHINNRARSAKLRVAEKL